MIQSVVNKGGPGQSRGPRLGPWLAGALLLSAFFAAGLDVAGRFRQPILVDIGPSTGRYGSGFEDSEETPPTTSRWTRPNAEFAIPLDVEASTVHFSVRAARYLDQPTRITVTAAGRPFAAFEQPPGRQRIQEMEGLLPAGPLNLRLRSEDPNLGMALDWIQINGARWHVPAREWTVWILPGGILASMFIAGASPAIAIGATALALGLLTWFAGVDPFGFVHSMRDVAVPALAGSLLSALIFRGQTALTLAVTATILMKGAFLFHPSYFYNDVRQNDRYVGALKTFEGSLLERSRQAQVELGVGYPRMVAGKKYAFPYSPLFYAPFTALPSDRDLVVRAIKHVALLSTGVEVALAFVLARALLPSTASAAAWFTFAFPILTSRMLYAMWSTLAGHALDLLVVVLAIRLVAKPDDGLAALRLFLGTLATFLTYVSSLFNTSAFLVALALLTPRARWRIVTLWLLAALLVVFGMYGSFTVSFVTEIVPAILDGAGHADPGPAAVPASIKEPATLARAISRIILFAGYGFPLLALAGLAGTLRRVDPGAITLKAYALAFGSLVLLRGLSFGLFKDMKELEYAGPAFAVFAAAALQSFERPLARSLIGGGLVVTGVLMQYGYFETWTRLVLQ